MFSMVTAGRYSGESCHVEQRRDISGYCLPTMRVRVFRRKIVRDSSASLGMTKALPIAITATERRGYSNCSRFAQLAEPELFAKDGRGVGSPSFRAFLIQFC